MLDTVLEKVETLLSKSFLISSYFPVLTFAVVNGAMLYWVDTDFREWIKSNVGEEGSINALYSTIFLIVVALVSYIFSTLNLPLRNILEGKFLPRWLSRKFEENQRTQLDELDQNLTSQRFERRKLKSGYEQWLEELRDARVQGANLPTCNYTGTNEQAAQEVQRLQMLRNQANPIEPEDLATAVQLLKVELGRNSADLRGVENSRRLDQHHQQLVRLIRYALDKVENEYIRLFNERQFNYSSEMVAPTRMGNVANSLRGYAESRYSLNLDMFWTRLQKVVQADEKFYSSLQDSKTQLDFLVSLFWLTLASTIVWGLVLLFMGDMSLTLLLVCVIGALFTLIWYEIALQNYRAFAELVRSCVDLYRFDLLKSLHIPLPRGVAEERQLWDSLTYWTGYGDDLNISYHHE